MKYKTKKIIITISANGFILLCIWILANSYVGRHYPIKRYRFHTDDTTFVKAIQTIKKNNKFLVVDSSEYYRDNYIPEPSYEYYALAYFKSKTKKNIIYKTRFATIKFRDTITTLQLRGFMNEDYTITIFYRDLDEDESEPYFKDFETSILPLFEKELGMKAEFQD
ncbi:MAG: hypothetical protein J0M05_10175 [Candidatus Kapabacteria bacterium]|nr:hypothetical protein [Candidatus Kapabacteria bacterium]